MAKKVKTDKNGNIDFGKYTVPEDWSEITFSQLCAINRAQKKSESEKFNIFDNLEILLNKKRSEIENLPYEFLDSIMSRMVFLKTDLPKIEPKPYIEVNGKRYVSNIEEKLTVAEYASIDTILRTDEDDLVSIIAVLFRLPDEKYDEDYELNKFDQRKEMFGKLSCLDVLPAIGFFLKCWGTSEIVTQLCSQSVQQIDSIVESIKNSRNNSDSPKLSWMQRRAIIRNLKKLKKQISTNSSSGQHIAS